MTFDEWFEDIPPDLKVSGDYNYADVKDAWNEAINQAQFIAWEYARGTRQPSLTCSRSDDIAKDIRKLETK